MDKVGPKTAAALMAQFGDLDALLARAQAIQKPSVRASVLESTERIKKNYALIYLDGAQDLPFGLEELKFQDPGLTTRAVMAQL